MNEWETRLRNVFQAGNRIEILLIVFISIFVSAPLFSQPYLPRFDDSWFHTYLVRFVWLSLINGQSIYWCPDWTCGFPFTETNNPPLGYDLTAIVAMVVQSEILAVKIVLLGSIVFSGIAMYKMILYFTQSRVAGTVSAVGYMLSPWHLIASAFDPVHSPVWVFMPLIILEYDRALSTLDIGSSIKAGIFAALLFLTHAGTAYLFALPACLFLLYHIFLNLKQKQTTRISKLIKVSIVSAITALELSAFWLLPLVFEAKAHTTFFGGLFYIKKYDVVTIPLLLSRETTVMGKTFYAGISLLVLTISAILLGGFREKDKFILLYTLMLLVSLYLSLGKNSGILTQIPGILCPFRAGSQTIPNRFCIRLFDVSWCRMRENTPTPRGLDGKRFFLKHDCKKSQPRSVSGHHPHYSSRFDTDLVPVRCCRQTRLSKQLS